MTKVAILSVPVENGGVSYYAMAGDKRSFGHTAGEALDLLTSQLTHEDAGTLVIVQSRQPDRFFDARQQRRLSELMNRWRTARDQGGSLPASEQAELAGLVDSELRATAARADALLAELDG
jgi:hypothetical protein